MDRLLLVDNDKANLKTIAEGLKGSGRFEIATALESKQAVNLLNNQAVSLLISGIHLPDFDGVELLAYMTRMFSSTPCIAMLDPGQPAPWFAGQKTPQNVLEFIEKPIQVKDLIYKINLCLRLKEQGVIEKGMTLKNFLPLIETVKKSCLVEAKCGKKSKGHLSFFRGILIDARFENKVGDAAVTDMLEWEGVKISISRLPGNVKGIPISIPLMEKIGVSWEKQPANPDTAIIETPVVQTEKETLDPALTAKLDASLKKYAGVLKTIKGYQGLAVLNEAGQVLAADFTEAAVDFNKFSADFTAILNQCSFAASRQGFLKCTGFTVHTEKGIIILIPSGNYRFIGLLSPEGNGFFMQIQLEKTIPQILKQ